jgi:hypothetical protein
MQKMFPGFSREMFGFNKEEYEKLKYRGDVLREPMNSDEVVKLTFPLIFGNFGCEIDLDKAEREVLEWLNGVSEYVKNDPKYDILAELNLKKYLARANILLGTIYAYKDEYVKSAYHFMVGIKANSVNLNMPYCDFIQYVLDQLNNLQIEDANFSGCGFELDNPMGSIGGEFLDARSALEVISEMEGENSEVIVAYQGRTKTFGHLVRRGSTKSNKIPEILDMYQTYVIDKDYNIKRVTIYYNGYFTSSVERRIRLAKGFKFNKLGRAWVFNKVVD